MIHASGLTFQHRDYLKRIGGTFDRVANRWEFAALTDGQMRTLRGLIGVVVSEPVPNPVARFVRKPTVIYGDDTTYLDYFELKRPTCFFGFSSLPTFIDYVEAIPRPDNTPMTSDKAWRDNEKAREFTGTRDMPDALRLARNGWTDGLGLASLLDVPHAIGKRRSFAVAGGSVAVGRMLAGNPSHMIRRKTAPANRSITLFVDNMAWIGQSVTIGSLRAFIIGAMVDILEREGYRCEIIVVGSESNAEDRLTAQYAIRVKSARDRVSLTDLNFALGHPSMLRRFMFACGHAALEIKKINGYVEHTTLDDARENEYYIPPLDPSEVAQISASDDPLRILDFIEPDGLPVRLRSR